MRRNLSAVNQPLSKSNGEAVILPRPVAAPCENEFNLKHFILSIALFLFAGCSARDQIALVKPVEGSVQHTVLFATNRTANDQMFDDTRSTSVSFGQATVAVPPQHKLGVVEYPAKIAKPKSEFGVVHAETTPDAKGFERMLAESISKQPKNARAAIVYVHGFNNTFAEALFLNTQLMHDYKRTEIPIMFSWPSSGRNLGYLHDHESILTSRSALEALLDTLERSDLDSFLIVGHSMGAQLVMEALRQRAIRSEGRLWRKLGAVALISPDIDLNVFEQQIIDMGGLPQPFILVASENDRMLNLSGVLNSSEARLGEISKTDALSGTNATVVSSSFATQVWSANHTTAFTSPEMIHYLSAFNPADNEIR